MLRDNDPFGDEPSPYDTNSVRRVTDVKEAVERARNHERRKKVMQALDRAGIEASPYDLSTIALIEGRGRGRRGY